MLPFMQNISKHSPCYTICYPNAGLPNTFGEYDQLPEQMADQVEKFASLGLLNILGGCCGTTPDHIRALVKMCSKYAPRKIPAFDPYVLIVAGLENLKMDTTTGFVNIGERCNVSGTLNSL
jgi:5-methyltetrahydrofolate--homocysteine methyltransferase